MRRQQLLKWTLVICSLLIPLTAVAGTLTPAQDSSGCGMVACHCDCCQTGSKPQCHKSSPSPCGCTSLPVLQASHCTPEDEGNMAYQPGPANPAIKPFIFAIYHPPKKSLLFSL